MESPGLEYSLSQDLRRDPVRYPRVNLSALLRDTHQQNNKSAISQLKSNNIFVFSFCRIVWTFRFLYISLEMDTFVLSVVLFLRWNGASARNMFLGCSQC